MFLNKYWIIYLLAFSFICGCNNNSTKSVDISPLPVTSISPDSEKTIVVKDYISYKFDENISFGNTISDWNRYLALKAKNNGVDLKEITKNETDRFIGDCSYGDDVANSYLGIFPKYPLNDGYVQKEIFGHFVEKSDDNIIRVDTLVKNEPILSGIEERIAFSDGLGIEAIDYISNYLDKQNFKRIAGNNPYKLNLAPATESEMQNLFGEIMDQKLNERISKSEYEKKRLGGKGIIYNKKDSYTTLYANNNLYAKMTYYRTNFYSVFREFREPTKLLNTSFHLIFFITFIPKSYSNIKLEDYQTEDEKAAISHNALQKELIDKALSK